MKAAVVECLRVLRAHRGRVVLLAFVLAFAALLFWLSRPRPDLDGAEALPPALAERAEESSAPVVTTAAQAVVEPLSLSGGSLEKVEVCGVGWVDADAEGAVDTAAILAIVPMAEASARLLESVRADGDFGAVTALVLQLQSPGEDRAASLIDGIVRLASATTDPHAYSLALEVCARQVGEGPCTALNAAQWARLDPGNGTPWLLVLGQAFARRDESAIDDALFHLGAAPRLDKHFLAESRLVAQHAGDASADLLVAGELSTAASVVRPGLGSINGISAADKSCSYSALSDPNRRELCEKVATALQDRSTSMMDMRIGSAIGRRLGWPDERFETADAIMAARSDSVPPVSQPIDASRLAASMRQPLDCTSIGKMLRYVGELATIGEPEYTRLWMERSGKADHYVRLGRAQHAATVAREAAEAAQRASAPAR